MFLSRGIRNKCLVCSLQTSNKIMDSFDSTDKVNTRTVHSMTMTKSVTLSIYYTKLAQLKNAYFYTTWSTLNSWLFKKKNTQTWSLKHFSFKVIKYLHFLPLPRFPIAQNIPIPYWKTAASCWVCTLVTKSTHSEHPHYFFSGQFFRKASFYTLLKYFNYDLYRIFKRWI